MSSENTFYMVYVTGGNPPNYVHNTYDSAKSEAIRLMHQTGRVSFVLKAVNSFKKKEEYTETELKDIDNTLPF